MEAYSVMLADWEKPDYPTSAIGTCRKRAPVGILVQCEFGTRQNLETRWPEVKLDADFCGDFIPNDGEHE